MPLPLPLAQAKPARMIRIDPVLTDRGSRYAVTMAPATDRAAAEAALAAIRRKKKYARATHNTWAVILPDGTQIKNDDGESGAGMVILRMLDRAGVTGHVIVVTRWYGGVHLGGDRFRHVQTCVRAVLDVHRAGG